jgi:hypothetical protein
MDNYMSHCLENEIDPLDITTNANFHVWAVAVLAFYDAKEVEKIKENIKEMLKEMED